MVKTKNKSDPCSVILRCAELWNQHNLSDNGIADKIMDEMGINLSYNSVTSYRKSYPDLFEPRDKTISREIMINTLHMNKILRSSKRINVAKELAKLDAKRIKEST